MMKRAIFVGFVAIACSRTTATTSNAGGAAPESADSALFAPNLKMSDLPVQMQAPTEGAFTQEIDHPYEPTASLGTFQQRYWYSTEFASGPDAPVIFNFCGEAPCDPWYVMTYGDIAKSLGASVVTLEHRYYGPSIPTADESLPNMKYLTIHNALEDAAAFERWAKVNLPLSGKWIAAGGSYSGMLSSFYRLTHPELVVGAWASSSPIHTVTAFPGYDANQATTMGPTCTLLIQQAEAAAEAAFADPNQCATVATELFGWSGACQYYAATDFSDQIGYIVDGAGQYGYESGLCTALQQEKLQPLQGFLDYLNPPLADGGDDSNQPSSQPTAAPSVAAKPSRAFPALSLLKKPDGEQQDFAGNEWSYQVCTEVGFFQIANSDRNVSVMPDNVNEAYYESWCQGTVGALPNVDQTNQTYYNAILAGQATNIFFVTGSQDPWSSLSFMDPSAVPAGDFGYNVANGSHCEDMNNLDPGQKLGVFKAHKMLHDLMVTWLDEAD